MKKQEVIIGDEGQRANLIRFLTHVAIAKPLKITIEDHQRKRTLSQMGLYWKWLHEVADKVADHTGHTPEEIHEVFKQKFLSPVPITIGGVTHFQYTTKKLSVPEMSAYMTQIYHFVTSELGVYVTLPEERMVA